MCKTTLLSKRIDLTSLDCFVFIPLIAFLFPCFLLVMTAKWWWPSAFFWKSTRLTSISFYVVLEWLFMLWTRGRGRMAMVRVVIE